MLHHEKEFAVRWPRKFVHQRMIAVFKWYLGVAIKACRVFINKLRERSASRSAISGKFTDLNAFEGLRQQIRENVFRNVGPFCFVETPDL